MSRADRFLNACQGKKVDTTPVWYMRQAGRYMAEYRTLRKKYSLLEMVHNPELATEVTLQPVNAFDVDAAIIFADILPIADALGLGLEFIEGEGPHFKKPIRTAKDVEMLPKADVKESLKGTIEAIKLTRKELDGKVPLIGFAGAPFTLASYMIDGPYPNRLGNTMAFATQVPDAWAILMETLTKITIEYMKAQHKAGAQALQLFDSWAGELSPMQYKQYVHPYSKEIFTKLKSTKIPLIHFSTGSEDILESLQSAGGTVMGVDHDLPLAEARKMTGDNIPLQGNLCPELLAEGTWREVQAAARSCLKNMGTRRDYIFNVGHGIQKETDPKRVKDLTDYVHKIGAAKKK